MTTNHLIAQLVNDALPLLKNNMIKNILSGTILKFNHSQILTKPIKKIIENSSPELFQAIPKKDLDNLNFQKHLYKTINKIRDTLKNQNFDEVLKKTLLEANFPEGLYLLDKIRLRAVIPQAHKVPEAKPAYDLHRDTWYANPQNQINLWLPLTVITKETSPYFYPEYFQKSIPNNSNSFDYDEFKNQGGWQKNGAKLFPTTPQENLPNPHILSCSLSQGFAFSAHHLHQTRPNLTSKIRWSIDFRIICQNTKDKAPNTDNQSTGDASKDYQPLEVLSSSVHPNHL